MERSGPHRAPPPVDFVPTPDSAILGPDPVCLLADQLRASGVYLSERDVAKLRTVIERGFVLFRKNGQIPLDIPL